MWCDDDDVSMVFVNPRRQTASEFVFYRAPITCWTNTRKSISRERSAPPRFTKDQLASFVILVNYESVAHNMTVEIDDRLVSIDPALVPIPHHTHRHTKSLTLISTEKKEWKQREFLSHEFRIEEEKFFSLSVYSVWSQLSLLASFTKRVHS